MDAPAGKTPDAVNECWQALDLCWHNRGTVSVMCDICLGAGEFEVWDVFRSEFLIVTCPRCQERPGQLVTQVCPCLERFDVPTILEAIKSFDMQFPELVQAVYWMSRAGERRRGARIEGDVAARLTEQLRGWAESHKVITMPHPKVALILHLLDKGMIQFEMTPFGVHLHAVGAKEEFFFFIRELKRVYKYDTSTIRELIDFAYGLDWRFVPAKTLDPETLDKIDRWLQSEDILLGEFERGGDLVQISSKGRDLVAHRPFLEGNQRDLEEVVHEAFGCYFPDRKKKGRGSRVISMPSPPDDSPIDGSQ